MNIDTEKENVCISNIFSVKKETFSVECDAIVPDVKPDVIASINTAGNICIYKKEISDGKVRIDGSVDAYITYLTDARDSIIRSLNTSIDFTHILDIENCNSEMNLEMEANLKSIECKVLNGRKVNLKATIDIEIKIYENKNEEIIKKIISKGNLQKQKKNMNINILVGQGNTKVIAKENVALKENCNFGEILKANCCVTNKEYKTSYNKILAKADAVIKIMYLTEENTIEVAQSNIPIMGFIDLPNVSDNNYCDINYLLKNIIIKPNSNEDHSINVEIEVEIDGRAYDNREIEIINDLYDPDYNIKYDTRSLTAISDKSRFSQIIDINENISLDDMINRKILDIDVKPKIENINSANGRNYYEGNIDLNIVFEADGTSGMETRFVQIPLNVESNISIPLDGYSLINNVEVKQNRYDVNDNMVNVQIQLNVITTADRQEELRIIDSIEKEEYEENRSYGMIIYIVKKGDTLWDIAKRFRTTEKDIRKMNNLDEDSNIKCGNQLYIIKNKKESA